VRGPIRAAVTILAVVASLTACGADENAPPPGASEAITFRSADGVSLAGRLSGPDDADAGVVLAHMYPADQRSWFGFADVLAARGYRVLTFDFRGYCPGGEEGCSRGERDIPRIWQDVVGAIDVLRDEGARRLALIGASMGGTASLIAAAREPEGVDAVVTLSAPTSFEGLQAPVDVLNQVTAAKLFLAGHADAAAAAAVEALYAASVQPKRPVILTTADHGTDILSGNQGSRAANEILGWLDRYVPAS
jgi:pimeloyl-ACP methyl ester carboxylesterase